MGREFGAKGVRRGYIGHAMTQAGYWRDYSIGVENEFLFAAFYCGIIRQLT